MAWQITSGMDLVMMLHLRPSGRSEVVSSDARVVFQRRAADEDADADSIDETAPRHPGE
jgi:hypothetical protein